MTTINDSDLFQVQRGGTSYRVNASDLMSTIQDTDLFQVQRGGTQYKLTALDIKDQLGGAPFFDNVDITPLTLAPVLTSTNQLTATTDIPLVDGVVPADVDWAWYYYENGTDDTGKTLITSFTNRQDTDVVTLPAAAVDKFVGCTVTYLGVTKEENQRSDVDDYPPLSSVGVELLLVGGGSHSNGNASYSSPAAGGGGGGVITNVTGEVGTSNLAAYSAITCLTDTITYAVTIGAASNASSFSGPNESIPAGSATSFSLTANAGDSEAYSTSQNWVPNRGGHSGSVVVDGVTTAGKLAANKDRGGSVSNICMRVSWGCDPDCTGMSYGAGGGASADASAVDGGDGVYTTITGTGQYVAGGGYGTKHCNSSPGSDGDGANNYGGGGTEYGQGEDGVLILRYDKTLDVANPGGGLTFSTVEVGDDHITTITAGSGNITFSN